MCRDYGYTLAEVRAMPMSDYVELAAFHRVNQRLRSIWAQR